MAQINLIRCFGCAYQFTWADENSAAATKHSPHRVHLSKKKMTSNRSNHGFFMSTPAPHHLHSRLPAAATPALQPPCDPTRSREPAYPTPPPTRAHLRCGAVRRHVTCAAVRRPHVSLLSRAGTTCQGRRLRVLIHHCYWQALVYWSCFF